MAPFKVLWHFFILKKYKTQMTPQNPNSSHLIRFLTVTQIKSLLTQSSSSMWHRDGTSIAWQQCHPPPHDSNSDDKWWKTHFGSSSSTVVCHSHYCFIVLAQPPVPHRFSSPLHTIPQILLFSLSVVTVLQIRFSIFLKF